MGFGTWHAKHRWLENPVCDVTGDRKPCTSRYFGASNNDFGVKGKTADPSTIEENREKRDLFILFQSKTLAQTRSSSPMCRGSRNRMGTEAGSFKSNKDAFKEGTWCSLWF
jgi:hypothetical protein